MVRCVHDNNDHIFRKTRHILVNLNPNTFENGGAQVKSICVLTRVWQSD